MDEIFSVADRRRVLGEGKTVVSLPAVNVTRAELIRYMVGRTIGEAFEREPAQQGEVVLEVRQLSLNRPGARPLHDISFELRKGEVLGLAGLMGSGRTETLETLFGAYSAQQRSGQIIIGGTVAVIRTPADAIRYRLGLVPEDRKVNS